MPSMSRRPYAMSGVPPAQTTAGTGSHMATKRKSSKPAVTASTATEATDYQYNRIADGLYIRRRALTGPVVAVPPPTNHIAVLDCSGSMTDALPGIRKQLKDRLPAIVAPGDTFSLIWFSGRGQYSTIIQGKRISDASSLPQINEMIDRWIRPVGATGFKEPLEEVNNVIDKLENSNPVALFFMTDGWENQWDRKDVVAVTKKLGTRISAATFVEYGYYTDHALLTQMAQAAGGELIQAGDFDRYTVSFEAAITRKTAGRKKEVQVSDDPMGGVVFTVHGDSIVAYEVSNGTVLLPEGEQYFYSVSPTSAGVGVTSAEMHEGIYAALNVYAQRGDSKVLYALVRATEDVKFAEDFSRCFGKQRTAAFAEDAAKAAGDKKFRYLKGQNASALPRDDAYTVLEMLNVLASDTENRMRTEDPEFKYSRISRKREDSNEVLSKEEMELVRSLTDKMVDERNVARVQEYQAEIARITEAKIPLGFTPDAAEAEKGYALTGMVWNESSANISLRIKKSGTVDLSKKKPEKFTSIPNVLNTHIWRNYAIVKDGLLNVAKLPVSITQDTYDKLIAQLARRGEELSRIVPRPVYKTSGMIEVVVQLDALPIINRNMVKQQSAVELFKLEAKLTEARSAQKVYNFYADKHSPQTDAGTVAAYGKDEAEWLKSVGITPGGFSPHTTSIPSADFYVTRELDISLDGYKTLPSVNEVIKRMEKAAEKAAKSGKKPEQLTGCAGIMQKCIESAVEKEGSMNLNKARYFDGMSVSKREDTRMLIAEAAQHKFAMLVGGGWFREFKSVNDNTLDLDVFNTGTNIRCTVELKEVKIPL